MHVQAIMDWQREARTGLAEAVYAEKKSTGCLAKIVVAAAQSGHRLLLTRLSAEACVELENATGKTLDYDAQSQTAVLGALKTDLPPEVAIVCGGMSDLPVAEEARRTLLFAGTGAEIFADVGVAGLWRLMERLEAIREFAVVVAVAGMEGAIFSVLAGLVRAPIVAVPTSVGYGVSVDGKLALNCALGSCAPGLVVVNVDNGFGAAQAALRILNLLRSRCP